MPARYDNPKHLKLRVGQRVQHAATGEPHGTRPLYGDVVDIQPSPTGKDTHVIVMWYPHDGAPPTRAHYIVTSLAERMMYLTTIVGKPYIPGVDPPRAFGALKRKRTATPEADTTASPAVPPVPPTTTTPILPMSNQTEKNAAIAAAIADALAATVPNADTITAFATNAAVEAVSALEPSIKSRLDEAEAVFTAMANKTDELVARLTADIERALINDPKTRGRVRHALSASGAETGKKGQESGNVILDALSQFYSPGCEAPANVLLASPPSFGKSFSIRLLGELYDEFYEHGCSDDMDEISTLLGSPVPDGKGSFIVVDGVLTQAVRSAAMGKTVLLLLDEVLRLTPRAQEWLLTFLTGVKHTDGTRTYRLRTRRAMTDGTLEVIECPTQNLHIVAATNLSVLTPIEAFWSRWETVRVDFTMEQATATAKGILASAGVADPGSKLAKTWAGIVNESRTVVSKGALRFPVDFRMLERAAMLSDGTVWSTARLAKARLVDNTANWNADTGDTDPHSQSAATAWEKRLETLANEAEAAAAGAAAKKAERQAQKEAAAKQAEEQASSSETTVEASK